MKCEDAYARFCKYEAAAAAYYAAGQVAKAVEAERKAVSALNEAEQEKEMREIKSFEHDIDFNAVDAMVRRWENDR